MKKILDKEKCENYKEGKCRLAKKNRCWEGLVCNRYHYCEQPLQPKDDSETCDYFKEKDIKL